MPRKPILRIDARGVESRLCITADPKRVTPEVYAEVDAFAQRIQSLIGKFAGRRRAPAVEEMRDA